MVQGVAGAVGKEQWEKKAMVSCAFNKKSSVECSTSYRKNSHSLSHPSENWILAHLDLGLLAKQWSHPTPLGAAHPSPPPLSDRLRSKAPNCLPQKFQFQDSNTLAYLVQNVQGNFSLLMKNKFNNLQM